MERMKTFKVLVTREVEVTLDETKFTDEFMQEFRDNFFNITSLEGHAAHLGWVHATGVEDLDYSPTSTYPPFIEGYGPANEMGIRVQTIGSESEVVE